MRRIIAAAIVALLGVTAPATVRAEDGQQGQAGGELTTDPGKEAEFVELINGLRADEGLETLAVHDELVGKARDWSRTMAEAGEIWHSDLPDGITVNWHRLGENVGTGGSVEALHQAFVDSPSHYENLVDPGFRHVGVGVTVDADGTIFVSEVFMELASQPAPSTPPATQGTPSPEGDEGGGDAAPVPAGPAPETAGSEAAPAPPEPPPEEPSDRLVAVLDRLRALDG